jgi:diguanylate cyclase (GGDEF)-like protein
MTYSANGHDNGNGNDMKSGKRDKKNRDSERRKALESEAAQEVREKLLEERGEIEGSLIEIAAHDTVRSAEHEEILAREISRRGSFYSDLVNSLCSIRYDEDQARVLWVNLLAHKTEMSDSLGRNVGVRVAALDYFKNIVNMLDEVKIVGGVEFIETERLAVTDGLTGIFNHRYFQNRLENEVNRAREDGKSLTLLMIDIDYFKQYNDLNGHIAGDVALREMATILRKSIRREDTAARYGGEEFAVVLSGVGNDQGLLRAEVIRSKIESADFPNEQVLPGGQLTVSIGVASFPSDCQARSELIAKADKALYAAKRGGRNRICSEAENCQASGQIRVEGLRGCWTESGQGPRYPLTFYDVSPQGAAFSCVVLPETGRQIQLTLSGIIPGGSLDISATVLWHSRVPAGEVIVGVEFERNLEDSQSILDKLI